MVYSNGDEFSGSWLKGRHRRRRPYVVVVVHTSSSLLVVVVARCSLLVGMLYGTTVCHVTTKSVHTVSVVTSLAKSTNAPPSRKLYTFRDHSASLD